ncbi:protein kinase [Kitasatospora sp. NBC_01287]|uniref:protein kinase domain-containing protein n=1 Tax=Kitasatospora sp. NBC_01287 TaxID=2903573 RepID=UPI00225B6D24|nr:protein kinase [Kitasatospora sp. NBC_01287]MCX4748170.1 protein kinase [Kitasatospora sp. NBC_01287]
MIGRALNGRYELVGTLGVGGMATVYHGMDRVLGRPVAVKVLNNALAEDPRFAERFSREAQHAAMLVHPRIAMVFDSGLDQDSPYIVMELVRGRSLGSVLAEQGALPVERAVGIAAAVCEALEVAHGAGLVHRDIKPANVMITDDGGVKVVDFGIARASAAGQQLTQTATVLGTAAYLSPEQATAAEVDGRADLYALGCVLTEMLTGQPPFIGDTPVGVAFKQVTEEPPPVSLRRPDVPPALDLVVARLLAKRPADRPADAGAARAELLAAVTVAGAVDRTAELLATSAPGADGDRTTVLPPMTAPLPEPPPLRVGGHGGGSGAGHGSAHGGGAHTSVMAPLPDYPGSGFDAGDRSGAGAGADAPARRPRRAMALALGAAGLAVVGLVGALAFANSSSGSAAPTKQSARPPASATSVVTAPVDPATPAAALPGTATGTPAKPSPTTPVAAIGALRADMAAAALPKDRQVPLLHTLDVASTAAAAGRAPEAVQALKAAQKQVRDLAKKHTVDAQTSASWQHRLDSIITSLNAQGGGSAAGGNGGNDGGGNGDGGGDGNGDNGDSANN